MGGWVTVDKPPLAFWLQSLVTRSSGFRPWTLMLPSVVLGGASLWLSISTVRRVAGRAAVLLSGVLLAATPIMVAMSRSNMPDGTLTFLPGARRRDGSAPSPRGRVVGAGHVVTAFRRSSDVGGVDAREHVRVLVHQGVLHPYYVVEFAPPLAALAAIGAVRAWQSPDRWLRAVGGSAIVATAVVQLILLRRNPSLESMRPVSIVVIGRPGHRGRRVAARSRALGPSLGSGAAMVDRRDRHHAAGRTVGLGR